MFPSSFDVFLSVLVPQRIETMRSAAFVISFTPLLAVLVPSIIGAIKFAVLELKQNPYLSRIVHLAHPLYGSGWLTWHLRLPRSSSESTSTAPLMSFFTSASLNGRVMLSDDSSLQLIKNRQLSSGSRTNILIITPYHSRSPQAHYKSVGFL